MNPWSKFGYLLMAICASVQLGMEAGPAYGWVLWFIFTALYCMVEGREKKW